MLTFVDGEQIDDLNTNDNQDEENEEENEDFLYPGLNL